MLAYVFLCSHQMSRKIYRKSKRRGPFQKWVKLLKRNRSKLLAVIRNWFRQNYKILKKYETIKTGSWTLNYCYTYFVHSFNSQCFFQERTPSTKPNFFCSPLRLAPTESLTTTSFNIYLQCNLLLISYLVFWMIL